MGGLGVGMCTAMRMGLVSAMVPHCLPTRGILRTLRTKLSVVNADGVKSVQGTWTARNLMTGGQHDLPVSHGTAPVLLEMNCSVVSLASCEDSKPQSRFWDGGPEIPWVADR